MVKQRLKSETHLDNVLEESSFYKHNPIFIDPTISVGRRRLGRWTYIPIDTSDIDNWQIHTVTQVDYQRLDSVSYKYYKRIDYWRAIAQVNGIKNALEDIAIGDDLAIPPQALIENALGVV